jgi:hypothetical protein
VYSNNSLCHSQGGICLLIQFIQRHTVP